MTVQIRVGNVFDCLADLPDESVHCVVTSPPYWGLRDYGVVGAIGLEPTFEEHIEALGRVFREVRRVLRRDGTLWLNYGDAYAGSWSAQSRGDDYPGNLEGGSMLGARRIRSAPKGRKEVGSLKRTPGLKPKDLIMMPARLALALQADGWWLRSEVVWHKPNPMPESVRDRPTCAHEKVFLLAKSARYFYDAEAVRTLAKYPVDDRNVRADLEHKSASTDQRNGIRPYKMPDGWDTSPGAHGKFHHQGREKGRRDKQRGHERRHAGFNDRWDAMSKQDQHANGANLRNVWQIATHPFPGAHFATFPPALVQPCIKAGTSEMGCCSACGAPLRRDTTTEYVKSQGHAEGSTCGRKDGSSPSGWDGMPRLAARVETVGWTPTCQHETEPVPCTVLDPFAGAGTVGLVADRLGRDAILIEINPEYAEMARRRIRDDAPLFTEVTA